MRALIIARRKKGRYAPFITEQVNALQERGVDCRYFPVDKSGFSGYLSHLLGLYKTIRDVGPDIVHAHYGLCGLLANFQRKVPVVTTYHGSDINERIIRPFSRLSMCLSAFNIFVSRRTVELVSPKKHFALIPCGINLEDYPVMAKEEARRCRQLEPQAKYVLFAGAFDNAVKNAPLAKKATALLEHTALIELKGYSRSEVAELMYAADALLMTSFTEGSPQVIKEALACGCPIVSVDVGDVRESVEGLEGCYVVERDPVALARALQKAFSLRGRTEGRRVIERRGLANDEIAQRIIEVYRQVMEGR